MIEGISGLQKLNLGCGNKKIAGYINVDIDDRCCPDIIWDLNKTPWPFGSNAFKEVLMSHVLEHIGASTEDFFTIIKELYRICAPDCLITMDFPHHRSYGFCGDPTHVRAINTDILMLFSKKTVIENRNKGWPSSPLAETLDVDFETINVEQHLFPDWYEKYSSGAITQKELDFAMQHYFNVVNNVVVVWKVCK